MEFEFLLPVSEQVLAFNTLLPQQTLGKTIKIHSEENFPDISIIKIALIGIPCTSQTTIEKADITAIRKELYKLYIGNWDIGIADLGDVQPGTTVTDTYFLVEQFLEYLLKENIIPIVIGVSQDITYPVYRSFNVLEQMVNLVSIDNKFDFGLEEEIITSESYLYKIITDQPANLFGFTNIGYQTYLTAQEEIDLIDQLFFEAYRLGEVTTNISLVEPALRDAHLVSLDVKSIEASYLGHPKNALPNGFTGREICAIARYAGISDKVAAFGIFEIINTSAANKLLAQIIWYFIEGVNYRTYEYPFTPISELTKYIVPIENEELVFYKSTITQRWWIEIPVKINSHNKLTSTTLLPCSHQDYLEACTGTIPLKWWKACQKSIN